jgi:hypothetical protein
MHWPLKRLGRPPGPSVGRRLRPWDPRQLTLHEYSILRFVAANPDMPKWLIAERFDMSPQRLSIISCCPLGQTFLKALRKLHEVEGTEYEMLLQSPEAIASVVGNWAIKY